MKAHLPQRILTGAIVAAALASPLSAGAAEPARKPAAKAAVKPAAKPANRATPQADKAAGPMEAIQALLAELQGGANAKLPVVQALEHASRQQPSPETAARLRATLGTDKVYSMDRVPTTDGTTQYRVTILPVHHANGPTSRLDWDDGTIDLIVDKDSVLTAHGIMDKLLVTDGDMLITSRGMGIDTRQRRASDGLWFGDAKVRVGSMRFTQGDQQMAILEEMSVAADYVDHGKTIDMKFDLGIAGIGIMGERVDDLHLGVRVSGIDRRAALEMQAANDRLRNSRVTMTAAEQKAATNTLLRAFVKGLLAHGALEIEDISARYHGNKPSITGRVAMPGVTEADLNNEKAVLAKLTAQFEVHLPMGLVRDIANQMAQRQVAARAAQDAAQNHQPAAKPDPAAVAQLAQTMTDVILGRLVGNGYARLDNDTLVSNVDFHGGQLRANGNLFDPAKLNGSAAAQPAAPRNPPGGAEAAPVPVQ